MARVRCTPADVDALLALLRVTVPPVARAKRRLGRVEERKGRGRSGRWRIDFGTAWPGRYLTSFRGVPLETRELADAVLTFVEAQVARGRALEDVIAEIAPSAAAVSAVEPLLRRWLESFERRVETGRRAPRTLKEYQRWAGEAGEPSAHFAYWYGKTLQDIDGPALEDWDYHLSKAGLSAKSRRNVMSGFRSFLTWVAEQRPGFTLPKFPWPEVDERQPAILTPELQRQVLEAIPEPERGIFLAMAETLIRPGEARVLRVRDWDPHTNQLRVSRAAKDQKTRGEVRGLKTRNAKVVPVVSFELFDWLERHVPAERRLADPDGPLFVNPDGREGGWWSHWALMYAWEKACAAVGVSGVTLYAGLKHSTATHLKALGADDRVLAQLAGHRDPRSVAFYAKLDASMVRSALHRLKRGRDGEKG